MSQTTTPGGPAGQRDEMPVPPASLPEPPPPDRPSPAGGPPRRIGTWVAASIVCLFAAVFLAGGLWALWKDRVDRDSKGFVSFGATELRTDTYAIVGDLQGDGPSWLYGDTLLGDTRVRATSSGEQQLFVGIARKDDILRYLQGAGYATVDRFEVRADTTHSGGAPSRPPAPEAMWAASTQGTGQQTLEWTPRSGSWSVVFMNADASARVDVRGDAAAKLPLLPWFAWGLLLVAAAIGLTGALLVRRAIRGGNPT